MSIKKCVNGSFVNDVYREYGTDTDTITSLPKTIIGDGQPISSYTIKGNMSQSGTPTPSNPIYPTECGDKTANLFDKNAQAGQIYVTDSVQRYGVEIPLSAGQYVISGGSATLYVKTKIGTTYGGASATSSPVSRTLSQDGYILIYAENATIYNDSITELMLNSGSTALPYQPYGYKIPILSNGVSYPAYLAEPIKKIRNISDILNSNGAVTCQIKKLVLTGNENITKETGNAPFRVPTEGLSASVTLVNWLCSHYEAVSNGASWSSYNYMISWSTVDNPNMALRIRDIRYNSASIDDFKSYLAEQYAAGTPVIIWYVLVTAETETFTAPSIPTSGTAESFDVDTTLKPSEVSLTYHGWHEHSDTKYTTP